MGHLDPPRNGHLGGATYPLELTPVAMATSLPPSEMPVFDSKDIWTMDATQFQCGTSCIKYCSKEHLANAAKAEPVAIAGVIKPVLSPTVGITNGSTKRGGCVSRSREWMQRLPARSPLMKDTSYREIVGSRDRSTRRIVRLLVQECW